MEGGIIVLLLSAIWLLPIPISFLGYKIYDLYDPEGRPIAQPDLFPVYDFIIIGAGSAGNVQKKKRTSYFISIL